MTARDEAGAPIRSWLYVPAHRAELPSRAGEVDAARAAYDQAIAACRNDVETAFLVAQRDALPAR